MTGMRPTTLVVLLAAATAAVLLAIRSGHRYGFDIMEATGLPSGTVYPALRRLEAAGCLTSEWEGDHLCVHGKGVSGRILVFEDSVEVHVHVGLTMMMFREPIRSAIEGSIDHYID